MELEPLAEQLTAMGWTCTLDAHGDYDQSGNQRAGRLQATSRLRYYGTFTVYSYCRVYWTPHEGDEDVELSDETWPVVMVIRDHIEAWRASFPDDDEAAE